MDRKLDRHALFLLTVLLLGTIVRFAPAVINGFPLNDGGMFLSMMRDLRANRYLLPEFTTYNLADIPFAYPPLGFYLAASLSDLLHVSGVTILLWLPALINTLSIPGYYKMARQFLDSRIIALLAVLIYALAPRAFLWQVMGGGITRAVGMLFLLLMVRQSVLMFREYSHNNLLLTTLYGMGSILSHPQTAVHAALAGALMFGFYGRSRRGVRSAMLTALGVILLTAPWWGLVLSRYGLDPMFSASQTSQRTLESYLAILIFNEPADFLLLPVLLLASVGTWFTIKQRDFVLIAWILLAYLFDPRGAEGIALLPLSMLAGIGLYRLAAWISGSVGVPARALFTKRRVQVPFLLLLVHLTLVAILFDFQLINTSLKPADLEMIDWVKETIPSGKTFLLATGREYSMSDPLQEWFPALTGQRSATTMQGLEWTLGNGFFPWYEEVIAFQHCADIQCVNGWGARNGVDYDYLVVLVPRQNDERDPAISLRSLAVSAYSSSSHLPVYESPSALIFQVDR